MSTVDTRKILLVEDDDVAALILSSYMEGKGLAVERETRGDTAIARILEMQPDLVVLDCNLPGMDGFEVCRGVRARYKGPIIMVTGRIAEVDHVLGLELGADDYLPKPAQPAVVYAHIIALLRRSEPAETASSEAGAEYRFGQFRIDRSTRSVYLGNDEVQFTTAEFDLLWQLASHAGEVLSRDAIMMHMRGLEYGGLDRSIDMRISRLRKRLGDDTNNPHRIKTVRAKGYLFSPNAWN